MLLVTSCFLGTFDIAVLCIQFSKNDFELKAQSRKLKDLKHFELSTFTFQLKAYSLETK
jgi:hypothetical protein